MVTKAATRPSNPILPYLIWDGVLAVVAVALFAAVFLTSSGRQVVSLLSASSYIGLIATGFALSLRCAAPNLAVGSIAALAGGLSALLALQGMNRVLAMVIAVLVAGMLGLLLGMLVAGLSIPSWATTLAAAGMIEMLVVALTGRGSGLVLRTGQDYPTALWFTLFTAVSIGGGVLWWQVSAVRDTLSAARRTGEPGRWIPVTDNIGVVVGLAGSSVLAALGGVAMVSYLRYAAPSGSGQMTTTALAAALLGGVSVFGRRAGLVGTFCAVLILQSIHIKLASWGAPFWVTTIVVGFCAVLGLVVSRLLETLSDRATPSSGTFAELGGPPAAPVSHGLAAGPEPPVGGGPAGLSPPGDIPTHAAAERRHPQTPRKPSRPY